MFVNLIIAIIKSVQYKKFEEKYNQSKVAEVEKELTSEFKKVFINNSGDIPKEEVECKSKVDENGKIICKISIDMKKTFENPEEFLKYFHLNESK